MAKLYDLIKWSRTNPHAFRKELRQADTATLIQWRDEYVSERNIIVQQIVSNYSILHRLLELAPRRSLVDLDLAVENIIASSEYPEYSNTMPYWLLFDEVGRAFWPRFNATIWQAGLGNRTPRPLFFTKLAHYYGAWLNGEIAITDVPAHYRNTLTELANNM